MNSVKEHTQPSIIKAVDESIAELLDLYKREPTRFFTENDLVCCLYRLICNSFENSGWASSCDKDGLSHCLIHCEYPTPFRCDMKNKCFVLKTDNDQTPNGGKYRRGHYDLVILNPAFLSGHSYSAIKCQNYAEFLCSSNSMLDQSEPMVLYGIELNFSRDTIKLSRGKDRERAIQSFAKEVKQDSAKLAAGLATRGFMSNAKMLTFIKGTNDEVLELLSSNIQSVSLATIIAAE